MGGTGTDWGKAFRDQERVAARRRERARFTRDLIRGRRERGWVEEELPPALRREVACERCGEGGIVGEMILTATGHCCQDCEVTDSFEAFHVRGVRSAVRSSLGLALVTAVPAFGFAVFMGLQGRFFTAMVLAIPAVIFGNLLVAGASGRHLYRTLLLAAEDDDFTDGERYRLMGASLACFPLAVVPVLLLLAGAGLNALAG